MRIRNISGQDLEVPLLGRVVLADAVADVPDDLVEYFLAGAATWEAADPVEPGDTPPPSKKAAAKKDKE